MISKYSSRINSVWQMRKIKIARYLLISLIFISLFFISSCAWFGGNDIPVFPTATISGAIRIEGAVPSEILSMMNTSSERTVVPSAFGAGTVSYTCEVKESDDSTIPAGSYTFNTESDDSGNVYYTIAGLPLTASPQTLKLTITLKVGTNEVLRSTEQELEGLSLTQPAFQKNIVLRPISEGNGSYSLTVNLDSSINISTETYKLYLYLYDPADPTNTSKIKDEYKQLTSNSWGWSGSLPSGTYKAIISLYKVVSGVEYLVYQFEEIVNIFKNLATNTWLKHSAAQEYIDDTVTPAICKITAGCISNFLSTNIYVDSSTTVDAASQTGSYLAPFSDIRNAFNYIRNISTSDSTTTYTIQVKGGSSFTFSSRITVDRNITVKCWSTTPGDNLGSATILADSSSFTGPVIFNISDGKKFTAHHGLIIDGNNKNVIGVEVSDGIFEMCGGGNKIRNCNIGLALSEKTSTNTVTANLTSGMITSNKKGVEVTSSNTLNVSGVITIDGNVNTSSQKNNVYLPDGITFNVNGVLTDGANICVSTATVATLETKVSIATGYSDCHATATNPPSAYIHSDLGDPIIYNATTSTVQIAKNGGNIKNSYDVKFSFAASSTFMKTDTAKAITIIPTITTLNASGTSIQLYYNPANQKLYLEETFENLYLPDIEDSDYNKVTWNAALYNSGVLITGYQPTVATDDPANKFTLPALPADKYTLLITANYLGIKHDAGFGVTIRDTFGSKKATVAKEVGDIVFNDGSAMPYAEYAALDDDSKNEIKTKAIALIFYKGTDCNDDGDTTVRTLGVGLKHNTSGLAWCTNGAAAYSNNITTIQCTPSGSAGALTFTGDKDGSNNLEQIEDFEGVNDTTTAANYPAFYFGKNYATNTVTNIEATSEFATGWYLPSIAELFQIYACRADTSNGFDIDAASEALGGDKFETAFYWTSSQYASDDSKAYYLRLSDGAKLDYGKSVEGYVCCIRAF